MDGMRGLDAWITSGRYSEELLLVTCECGEQTRVVATTEYGMSEWEPGECVKCGKEFPEDATWETDEPDIDDRWEDDE